MNSIACAGLMAAITAGSSMIWPIPRTASVANQTHMTGPKNAPTRAVPLRWITNSVTMMTSASGTMNRCNCGVTISSPSTAPSTEIAGVIMPSP